MFQVVGERVFPFLRELGGEESACATHMRDARFTIPTAGLLTKVVELLDAVPMEDRDTKGDSYEYMLGKLATAGTNGQFRTPRHIIELMVAMTELWTSHHPVVPMRRQPGPRQRLGPAWRSSRSAQHSASSWAGIGQQTLPPRLGDEHR
jgi:hypothetical protein